MGANCVSDSRRVCQNDLQMSASISNQPVQMGDQISYKEDFDFKDNKVYRQNSYLENKIKKQNSYDDQDESLLNQEDLLEYHQVGGFPILNIAVMQDIKLNHEAKDYIIEDNSQIMQSKQNNASKLFYRIKLPADQDEQQKRTIIEQPFQVIKKPSLGQIIQQIKIIPKECMVMSYNISKNPQYYQNNNKMNSSQDIPSSTKSNSSSFLTNSASKLRKLTIFINKHLIVNNTLLHLVQTKQYHVSIKLTYDKQKDLLDNFLSRVDCKRLSIEMSNIAQCINPVYIHNLNILKLNLQGFSCSSTNYEFQESLFYFVCSNSTQLKTLKIKTRECSIDHFFHLLENEICTKNMTNISKISLDLVFFGAFQSDINLLTDIENLIKSAFWINKWSLSLRFKQRVTCEIACEFEKNSHGSISESYLMTQPKESFLHKPIDQSFQISPIIKSSDINPQVVGIRRISFDKKQQNCNQATFEYPPARQSVSQLKKPSLKKLKKSYLLNNNQNNYVNQPLLMLMHELKQNDHLDVDHSNNSQQEGINNTNQQMPKSPERVTFAHNNILPYSVVKQLDQCYQQQILQTRQRNKSNFLDSSISVGIDLLNEKPIEEGKIELLQQQQSQIVKILKLIQQKCIKKICLIDQSGKINSQDLLNIIQQFNTLKSLTVTLTLDEDQQFYCLQNIIRNNQGTLKKLTLNLEKKIIISVFDDQRLFNQIEKLTQLNSLVINYQTGDFLPKYILKMKNILNFQDLYSHKVSINKFNPFINTENKSNNSKILNNKYNKQNNFNQLIQYLKETKLLSFKSKQLQNNIPEQLLQYINSHLLIKKITCQQFCVLRNFKIKHQKVYFDISTFYI